MVNPELMRGLPPRLDRTAFDRLLSEVAARRKEFERQKQISPDIIDRFRTLALSGIGGEAVGGWECSPAEFCHLIEAISAADGSAGWVASFGVGAILLSALPVSTLSALTLDTPDIVIAGGIFPARPATTCRAVSPSTGVGVSRVAACPRTSSVSVSRHRMTKRLACRAWRSWRATRRASCLTGTLSD